MAEKQLPEASRYTTSGSRNEGSRHRGTRRQDGLNNHKVELWGSNNMFPESGIPWSCRNKEDSNSIESSPK